MFVLGERERHQTAKHVAISLEVQFRMQPAFPDTDARFLNDRGVLPTHAQIELANNSVLSTEKRPSAASPKSGSLLITPLLQRHQG